MKTDDFWSILQRAHRAGATEGERLAALTRDLERLSEAALRAFDGCVTSQIGALDTEALRDIATQLWVLSDDAWLHLRAWCVSEGRDFIAALNTNPSKAFKRVSAERGGPFDPPNGELFLYCAEYARVARTRAVA